MVDLHTIKKFVHGKHSNIEKILLLLASFEAPTEIKDLKALAAEAGFKIPANWNLSATLKTSNGAAIRVPQGWEITDKGWKRLESMGVSRLDSEFKNLSHSLRQHLTKVSTTASKDLMEEAILCYEGNLLRSAVVMSWISALYHLYEWTLNNKLDEFNAEALRVDPKWKPAATIDDFAAMKEATFLDRLHGVKAIGKSVKDRLGGCLKLRNGCGHPNSLALGKHDVSGHIEALLLNVFHRF